MREGPKASFRNTSPHPVYVEVYQDDIKVYQQSVPGNGTFEYTAEVDAQKIVIVPVGIATEKNKATVVTPFQPFAYQPTLLETPNVID